MKGHWVAASIAMLAFAAAAAGEQVSVRGLVLSAEGQPVTGCEVLVRCRSYESDWAWPTAQTRTGEDGGFACALEVRHASPAVQVAAVREGLAVAWTVAPAGGDITLKLGAVPSTCSGLVTDPEGRPIANARVHVRTLIRPHQEGDNRHHVRQHLELGDHALLGDTTDEGGVFEIRGLPLGARVGLVAEAEGCERLVIAPELSAGQSDIRLVLQSEATISGRLTHEGRPVAGVRVIAIGQPGLERWAEARSGEDGSYRLEHLRFGTYSVRIEPTEELTALPVEDVTVRPRDQLADVDLALIPGGLVTGTVSDADTGERLAGVPIGADGHGPAWPDPADTPMATTDQTGSFKLRLPPGPTRIFCHLYDYPLVPIELRHHDTQVVEGQTVSDLDFVLRTPERLSGEVSGPDGQPVAGAEIALIEDLFKRPLEHYVKALSGPDGHFELLRGGSQRGDLRMPVLARHVALDLAGLAVIEDTEQPVQLRLSPGAYAATEVSDAQGNPLAGQPVTLNIQHQDTAGSFLLTAWSDEQGRARFGPLATDLPIEVRLFVRADETARRPVDPMGAWRNLAPVTLNPGQEHRLPPLRLDLQQPLLEGWVRDAELQPVAAAIVASTRCRDLAFSDESGHFVLRGLEVPGGTWVAAAHPTEPLFATSEGGAGREIEPNLVLQPLSSVSGQAVDGQGRPVGGAIVRVVTGLQMVPSRELRRRLMECGFRGETAADDQGRWTITGLLGGFGHKLSLVHPEHRDQTGDVEVEVEPGEALELGRITLRQAGQ